MSIAFGMPASCPVESARPSRYPRTRQVSEVSMAVPSFSIAVGTYGLTQAIKNGDARSQKFDLKPVEVTPITQGMRRMVRALEFDICEMAFTTYLCAKAAGKPFTA